MRIVIILLFFLNFNISLSVYADQTIILHTPSTESEITANIPTRDYDEIKKRAAILEKQIRCAACGSQTIANSQSAIALSMKEVLWQKLLSGASDEEIILYFQSKYGHEIIVKPELNFRNFLLWLIPLSIGILVTTLLFRQHR